ncbi:molybdopterin-dependent oxidoreductase [Thalassospira xiamenensis]|uniref:molybdopterin-dependent oxidoreductase n=1 Tax=Thalassospira xiamenensis TaxID=220697 RepID=UPI000DEDACC1|nr:molybdopterin-dependent oxidoreductase [Thalassospira xiamenensis]
MKVFKLLVLAVLAGFAGVYGLSEVAARDFHLKVVTENGARSYALSDLDRLPQVELETETTWSRKKKIFSGPLVRDVLEASGIGNKELIVTAKAYNGYHVTIPVNEFYDWDVLLATRENGEPIPLDARGPIRFVYDFAEVGAGKDSYWIWMLQELSVSPE